MIPPVPYQVAASKTTQGDGFWIYLLCVKGILGLELVLTDSWDGYLGNE